MNDTSDNLGPFELGAPIGEGGMSTVFQGRHSASGERVALKLTRFEGNAFLRRAFAAEISAMARVYHPGVVQIHDWGTLPDGSGNWCAMDLAPHGALSPRDIRDWDALKALLEQVLDALGHAHARNIIHRDLKPANVLVFGDKERFKYKLADFGLAYSSTYENNSGQRGAVVGTPVYMAPEQLHGLWREFGPWTDLYALGCMAFEIAAGSPPYLGDTPVEVAIGHIRDPTPKLHPRFPVPRGFEDWIDALLKRDWVQRPHNAMLAKAALDRLGPALGTPTPLLHTPEVDLSTLALDPTMVAETLVDLGFSPAMTFAKSTEPTFNTVDVPIPNDWRTSTSSSARFSDAGLGLFGIRQTKLIGHEAARDEVWARLRRVVTESAAHVVILDGELHEERERLAQWVAERVSETTSLQTFELDFGIKRIGLNPFLESVRNMTFAWGLKGHELREHLGRTLRRLFPISPKLVNRVALVLESESTSSVARLKARTLFSELIDAAARQSPVMLSINGLGDDAGAWFLIERSLKLQNRPILFVINPSTEKRLVSISERWIRSAPTTAIPSITGLTPEASGFILDSYIRLEPNLRAQWIDVISNDVGFAMNVLRFMITQGALVPTPSGYQTRADTMLPDSPDALIRFRLTRLGEAHPTLPRLITAAAAFDQAMTYDEWTDFADLLGLTMRISHLEHLLQQGFLSGVRGRYTFESEKVRRLLAAQSETPDVHRLIRSVSSDSPLSLLRRAELKLLVSDVEGAAEDLIHLARNRSMGQQSKWSPCADRVAESLPPDAPLHLWIQVMTGRDRSKTPFVERFEFLEEFIANIEDPSAEPALELRLEYLSSLCQMQRIDEAHVLLHELLEKAPSANYPALHGGILSTLGWVLVVTSAPDDATEKTLKEAIANLTQSRTWGTAALAASHLAMIPAREGNLELAQEYYENALEFAQKSWDIGRLPRVLLEYSFSLMMLDQFEEALEKALQAWLYGLSSAPRMRAPLGANYAIALAHMGEFDEAHSILDDTLRILTNEVGHEFRTSQLHSARAIAYALADNKEAWDEHVATYEMKNVQLTPLAHLAASAWEKAGDVKRAKDAAIFLGVGESLR